MPFLDNHAEYWRIITFSPIRHHQFTISKSQTEDTQLTSWPDLLAIFTRNLDGQKDFRQAVLGGCILSAQTAVCVEVTSDKYIHKQSGWSTDTQKNTIHDYSQLHSQNGLVVDIQMASKASSSGSSWWEAAQRSRGCRPLRFICRNHADKTWGFHLQVDLCASFSFGVCSGHEAGYTTLSALLLTWHQIALCACSRGQESSS
jgi:ribosomal protein S17